MAHGLSPTSQRRPDATRELAARTRSETTEPETIDTESTEAQTNVRFLRKFDRRRTNLRAIVYRGDAFQSVLIRDASQGGLGLEGCMSLLPGDTIHLHLLSGHRYRGTVRWWCNGHCGVSFARLLPADDLLLVAAKKKAR